MSLNHPPPQKHARVLACVLCQHRKIKCDRNFPCANCIKANVTCTPSTPAPARKRRRPNQDLQERLSRCEELLKQYASAAPPPPPHLQQPLPPPPPPPQQQQQQRPYDQPPPLPPVPQIKPEPSEAATPGAESTQSSWKPACKMVNEEGGARFMDSFIWASIYEELQAMRDIVETEDPEEASVLGSEELTPENHTDLFFHDNASTSSLEELHPDSFNTFKLWQIFLDRVHPLTKVIHAPTLQSWVLEAASNMANLAVHRQALLFSIFNLAVLSLSDTESSRMLGTSKELAMQRFTAGIKVALVRLNFLKNYNMAALQALVLYLGRYDRHAAWILSGTVIRIAQKMGYHRDGDELDLDPFETEMRRRVWWQLVIQDSKYAMLSGLKQSMLPPRWDTKMPQNVNDADMVPGSSEPIRPREGPTEMAFCHMLNEIYRFKMAADTNDDATVFEAAMLGQDPDDTSDSALHHEAAVALRKFRTQALELNQRLAALENKYVDVNAGNVHKAALSIRPMVTNRLDEILLPAHEQPEWGSEIFGPKDSLFKMAIMCNESRMETYDRLAGTGFLWFVKLHFQLDMFAVMTGQLCQRPTGSLSDRAWSLAERVYAWHTDLYELSQKQYLVLAQFTLKAWKTREQAHLQAGQMIETPSFIRCLQELMPPTEGRSLAHSSATPPVPSPSSSLSHPLQTDQPTRATSRVPQPQQHQQQHRHQRNQPQPQTNGEMDTLFGGYMDMLPMNWDFFGDMMVGNGGDELSAAMFGGLGGLGLDSVSGTASLPG